MLKKSYFFVLFLLLLCASLSYFYIDRMISAAYLDQSLDYSEKNLRILKNLIKNEWIGKEKKIVIRKINESIKNEKDIFLKEEIEQEGNDIIFLEGVKFVFISGKLAEVE